MRSFEVQLLWLGTSDSATTCNVTSEKTYRPKGRSPGWHSEYIWRLKYWAITPSTKIIPITRLLAGQSTSETLDLAKNVSPLGFSTTKILHLLLEVGCLKSYFRQLLRDTRTQLDDLSPNEIEEYCLLIRPPTASISFARINARLLAEITHNRWKFSRIEYQSSSPQHGNFLTKHKSLTLCLSRRHSTDVGPKSTRNDCPGDLTLFSFNLLPKRFISKQEEEIDYHLWKNITGPGFELHEKVSTGGAFITVLTRIFPVCHRRLEVRGDFLLEKMESNDSI
jgi:hypothetical protein